MGVVRWLGSVGESICGGGCSKCHDERELLGGAVAAGDCCVTVWCATKLVANVDAEVAVFVAGIPTKPELLPVRLPLCSSSSESYRSIPPSSTSSDEGEAENRLGAAGDRCRKLSIVEAAAAAAVVVVVTVAAVVVAGVEGEVMVALTNGDLP
jgi:hypothetical protein